MDTKSLTDEMIAFINTNPEGVSSQTLAQRYLKFVNPGHRLAEKAVRCILGNDKRCILKENGAWYGNAQSFSSGQSLSAIPLAVVHILTGMHEQSEKMMYLSIWSPNESSRCLLSAWLVNPETLSYDEQEILRSNHDEPFENRQAVIARMLRILQNKTVLFLSYRQQEIVERHCIAFGDFLSDDILLLSDLLRVVEKPVPKPLTVNSCYHALFNREPVLNSAYHYGEIFTECIVSLLASIHTIGITTRKALDGYERQKSLFTEWPNAYFSLNTIMSTPEVPGVYGFRNTNQEYIYVGKAKNLKRRLLSYFRRTEESPEKLIALRQNAVTLTISVCGSELESLILEYRLIKKHDPVLNKKQEINERKGTYTILKDCIILLPHAEKEKGMSLWFRQNQKILLKSFYTDFKDSDSLRSLAKTFFFQQTLPPGRQDFPEQEIVSRWVANHTDLTCMVPVYRMSGAEEIANSIASYCRDIHNP